MPSISSDVFLDPEDEFTGSVGSKHGVVKVRTSTSTLNIFSEDPDQLERLGEACLEAARDLRTVAARSAA